MQLFPEVPRMDLFEGPPSAWTQVGALLGHLSASWNKFNAFKYSNIKSFRCEQELQLILAESTWSRLISSTFRVKHCAKILRNTAGYPKNESFKSFLFYMIWSSRNWWHVLEMKLDTKPPFEKDGPEFAAEVEALYDRNMRSDGESWGALHQLLAHNLYSIGM